MERHIPKEEQWIVKCGALTVDYPLGVTCRVNI